MGYDRVKHLVEKGQSEVDMTLQEMTPIDVPSSPRSSSRKLQAITVSKSFAMLDGV